MFSKFFIDRPRFSTVLALTIMIAGTIAIKNLAVQEYPTLTPPQITVQATYPGADAETLAKTVAAPLEEAINGVNDLIYMTSTASSSGVLNMSFYFKVGVDPAMAKVDVNNRVQTSLNKLPEAVRRQGIGVRERTPDILKVLAFVSEHNKRDAVSLYNYVYVNVLDDLKRVPGVGDAFIVVEKKYSMRLWLKPDKLAAFGLTPLDVSKLVMSQNEQFAAGGIGQEPVKTPQVYTYSIKTEGRLKKVEEFESVIIRSNPDGSALKLKDVARVELASENYDVNAFYKKQPAIPVLLFLSPGANALDVAKRIDETLQKLSKNFPSDIQYYVPYDPTIFVRESIHEMLYTLALSILLVVLVVYVFLGNVRATAIPVLAIPVSIIGSFAGIYAAGFSINLLTLFGLILAIGLVVDDAIVVIENVERILREEKLSVKEATVKAMGEITGPVIAIMLVLSAVFIPASFMGGFSGKMYQQFAITIAISMTISGIVALTLTPALCVIFLKEHEPEPFLPIRVFQKLFDLATRGFTKGVRLAIKWALLNLILFGGMIFLTFHLMHKLPTGLVPMEDKGAVFVFDYLMPGSSLSRTENVVSAIEDTLRSNPDTTEELSIAGLDLASFANKTDASITFARLTDWSERKSPDQTAMALAGKLMEQLSQNKEALIFAVNPPPIMGMSMTGGFEMYVQDRTGGALHKLNEYVQEIVRRANERPQLTSVRTTLDTNVPQYFVSLDRGKAKSLDVEIGDVYSTLQMSFGKAYINDFNLYGKTYHVNIQAEGEFREDPNDYRRVFVRSNKGQLIPISSLIKIKRIVDANVIERFNMFQAAKVTGEPKPGFTSGDAMRAIEEVSDEVLPSGYTITWAGTSYQENLLKQKGNIAFIYAIIFVLLILVALYESWMAPIAIVMSIPFAVFGAVLGLLLRGLENDIYFQVGIITLVGLAAKNAILIVEFAEERLKRRGMSLLEATIEASKIRFRPIVMTSFAFIAGSLPLAVSAGAGANSRHIIGTTVVAGMLFATLLGIFFIPLFYYLVIRVKIRVKQKFAKKVIT